MGQIYLNHPLGWEYCEKEQPHCHRQLIRLQWNWIVFRVARPDNAESVLFATHQFVNLN